MTVVAGLSILLVAVSASAADKEMEQRYQRGAQVYEKHCVGCHGVGGDGKGFERVLESIRPPDFTAGEARYKSTTAGAPPTVADLSATVAVGVPRTSMPHHNYLDEPTRQAVVTYVSSFFPAWVGAEAAAAPVQLPPQPRYLGSTASIDRGSQVYDLLGCAVCHGPDGGGAGVEASRLPADDRGLRQRPADLRQAIFKAGGKPEDVFTTLLIGLNGTAMTPYAQDLLHPDSDGLREGDGWHLAKYVLSLGQMRQ